ncbi:D-2-hydroxyacid dehydrogenase [Roseomonas marmotae]|uniref:D-2-hydroxyacid dehydrogenase n=2 Tax=Roseomonas marmotae TaxID=2768161 RepID=A0ABS3KGW9_9PROT|nr:D-2-hydroxyacid dehydrogenase [Roseomonas marmotae]MBO1076717.1 D-2-hydroxyacid dehydrogenase [Roseomonas marmotae]QTI77963.1 D-2-hydroxyacid dehydrogenase [Roseomonas marmotae]
MRIHIQNPEGDALFAITPAQVAAALARHPDFAAAGISLAHDEAGLWSALAEAEVLVTWTRLAARHFPEGVLPGAAPKLKAIFCTSAGVDRLAPFAWLPPGVALLNNRGTHGAKAGEFGLMALLMLANHIPTFAQDQQKQVWSPRFGSVLAGRTVCVVGLGSLGGAVAERAAQFGMTVIGVRNSDAPHPACSRVVSQDAIDSVLPEAEFLVLACPLTPRTQGLLDRRRMALLPRGAKLVNIARGPVWDEDALCDALESGHLAGAVTDVQVQEPLPAGDRLWTAPNLLITPHMSADDPATYNDQSLDLLFQNLRAMRQGQPMPQRVDTARGY